MSVGRSSRGGIVFTWSRRQQQLIVEPVFFHDDDCKSIHIIKIIAIFVVLLGVQHGEC